MSLVYFVGITFNNVTIQETIRQIEDLVVRATDFSYIVTLNIAHVILLNKDRELKKIIQSARIVVPDGASILLGTKILGKSVKERVTGVDLLVAFSKVAAKRGYTFFFLGASPGVAAKAAKILVGKNPGLEIIGTYSPPFNFENNSQENRRIVNMINKAEPSILFVALGIPKQEKWIWRHRKELHTSLAIGIGAAFDFVAGSKKRAPLWMQKYNLEWFFRLCQEPRRLWKRYIIGIANISWLVMKEFFKINYSK